MSKIPHPCNHEITPGKQAEIDNEWAKLVLPFLSKEDIKHAAELANKSQIEQLEKWRVIEEVKKLINNEIAQAHIEGSPSKRLTSLFIKVDEI